MEEYKCHICGNDGFKTDGECNIWCEKCLNKLLYPTIIRTTPKISRNSLCPCNSGIKYKFCCLKSNT